MFFSCPKFNFLAQGSLDVHQKLIQKNRGKITLKLRREKSGKCSRACKTNSQKGREDIKFFSFQANLLIIGWLFILLPVSDC